MLRSLERGALVAAGNERKVRGLPDLAAVRVRAAAGLKKVSARVSLSGEIERDTDLDELSTILESAPASVLSRGRALAADALVGCSSLDLVNSTREEGRGRVPPRMRNGGMV
jgi:hypothetical protein